MPVTDSDPLETGAMTTSQALIWMSQRLSPASVVYNMAHRFDIESDVDPDTFRLALQALVDRSDALRTVFAENSGESCERVLDSFRVEVPVVDLSGEPEAGITASRWMDERARKVFDLSSRCHDSCLLKLGEKQWIWFFNVHHLIADAWAVALICRHIGDYYDWLRAGKPLPDEPLTAFLDYRRHEQAWRKGDAFVRAREHWQEKSTEPSGLVALYGRKGSRSHTASSRLTISLGRERSRQLNQLAEQPGFRGLSLHLSRFNVLATVVFAFLHRIGDGQRLTIGTPAHNRPSQGFRDTIGLFIETLPFSATVAKGETFTSLHRKLAKESQYFLRHAQPGCSSPELSRLYNVVFNYINTGFGSFGSTAMDSSLVHSGHIDSGHDLRIQIHDLGETGEYVVHFDCKDFTLDGPTREHMPGHFLKVIDAMVAEPDMQVGAVGLASASEWSRLVDDFNAASGDGRTDTVLNGFARRVAETPDSPAVVSDGAAISYGELDRRSNRIARNLVAQGVTEGDRVGLHMRRSTGFVVAVLGALKCGAIFIPLESRLPVERLGYIVSDSGMKLLLTDRDLLQRTSSLDVPLFSLGSILDNGAVGSDTLSLPNVHGAAGSYVIYTSGSTGYPKGVLVSHHALASYVEWAHRCFADGSRCDFPLYSSIGFDLTITSLFVPLYSGATVVVYPEQAAGIDLAVLDVFADDAVDVVKLTPAHLSLVLEQAEPVKRIKSLILGGENLTTALAAAACSTLEVENVFNEYGPTEAVVGCMRHRFDPAVDRSASVPIGVPADHHRIYLLDAGMNPVPAGVTGELFIAGRQLADGYLSVGSSDADRFMNDPFSVGGRMYRTGDLARFNMDGLVEYLGRADDQIKVRGVRVEPAEISRAMLAFPGIDACHVDVVEVNGPPVDDTPTCCARCGLSSQYPGVSFDQEGVCNLCTDFESYRERAQVYFNDLNGLHALLAQARKTRRGRYDCIMLLSGGKDSTYAFYRLVEQGPDVLALTLDNGFISEDAKTNIKRVVASTGVDHRFIETPHMNEIFRDSLERHSNVCQGCFKTIYTLALQTAMEEGIPYIMQVCPAASSSKPG